MPRRYHPALVALHWIVAVLILVALAAGTLVLAPAANSDPGKLISFRAHMTIGATVLVLMLVRLVVRWRTAHPPPAGGGALGLAARLTHWALYGAAIAMALSGITLAVTSGLGDAVFGDGPMPPDFAAFPARAAHGALAAVLMALIALHVAAALWHQVVRRDGIMARIWFGQR